MSRWESAKHIPDAEYLDMLEALSKQAGKRVGFVARYSGLREQERLNAAMHSVLDVVPVGEHKIQLLRDGWIIVNGHIHIFSHETQAGD